MKVSATGGNPLVGAFLLCRIMKVLKFISFGYGFYRIFAISKQRRL